MIDGASDVAFLDSRRQQAAAGSSRQQQAAPRVDAVGEVIARK
jgi:hypothetical protein